VKTLRGEGHSASGRGISMGLWSWYCGSKVRLIANCAAPPTASAEL